MFIKYIVFTLNFDFVLFFFFHRAFGRRGFQITEIDPNDTAKIKELDSQRIGYDIEPDFYYLNITISNQIFVVADLSILNYGAEPTSRSIKGE